MKKHNKFSWIFCILAIIFCNLSVYAEDTSSNSETTTVQICPKGSYVTKCGDYSVGYSWLTSRYSTTCGTNALDISARSDTTVAQYFEQMRTFFAGLPTLECAGGNPVTCKSGAATLVMLSENCVKGNRNSVLKKVCDPTKEETTYVCEKCPNNANIPMSTVDIITTENSETTTSTPDNWNFHTIADCYQSEFEDDTGTFIYLQEGVNGNVEDNCYFGNTISKSVFTSTFWGTLPGSRLVTVTPTTHIPDYNGIIDQSDPSATGPIENLDPDITNTPPGG